RAARRGPALGAHRGAGGPDPGPGGAAARRHAGRDPGRARRGRCAGGHRHAVAGLPAAPHHAQKKTAHATEQGRADVLRRRWAWFKGQPDLDPDRLVFVDETWASTNMARTHGRAPRGERLRAPVPHGHWKTTTFVAGLRNSG